MPNNIIKYNGPLCAESFLKSLSPKSNLSEGRAIFNIKYFKMSLINETFGYKMNKDDKMYKKLYTQKELLSFEDKVDISKKQLCEWKFSFQIKTIRKEYVLFCSKKDEYMKWMRVLNIFFNKIDIINPLGTVDIRSIKNSHIKDVDNPKSSRMSAGKRSIDSFSKPKQKTDVEKEGEVDIDEKENDVDSIINYKEELKKTVNDINKSTIYKKKDVHITHNITPQKAQGIGVYTPKSPKKKNLSTFLCQENQVNEEYLSKHSQLSVTSNNVYAHRNLTPPNIRTLLKEKHQENTLDKITPNIIMNDIPLNSQYIPSENLSKIKQHSLFVFSKNPSSSQLNSIYHKQIKKTPREITWDALNSDWKDENENEKEKEDEALSKRTNKTAEKPRNLFDNLKLHIKKNNGQDFCFNIESLHYNGTNNYENKSIKNYTNKIKDNYVTPSVEEVKKMNVFHMRPNYEISNESVTSNESVFNNKLLDKVSQIQQKIEKVETEDTVYLGKDSKSNKKNMKSLKSPNNYQTIYLPEPGETIKFNQNQELHIKANSFVQMENHIKISDSFHLLPPQSEKILPDLYKTKEMQKIKEENESKEEIINTNNKEVKEKEKKENEEIKPEIKEGNKEVTTIPKEEEQEKDLKKRVQETGKRKSKLETNQDELGEMDISVYSAISGNDMSMHWESSEMKEEDNNKSIINGSISRDNSILSNEISYEQF